ncbi:MAG: lysophospholipase [Sedimenticola sp.]|uniref:Lysophospholipase n=1 Tax=Sedimenticola thiotaurini TaxID=1543721 RepID=A0A558D0H9_9GAMM|nr:lysophospholipase [Sedimenticola sp.]MCW8921884.1 lysophospholipase [Sedimenticola sp.]MCW8976817.1 lysophospholipase [Sedimenticola sp.]TVT54516.1 MAG: lysophospholipase [Sedimenticola thiotaurini]
MKLFATIILSIIALYLLAGIWLYFMQHRLIYYPTQPIPHNYLSVPFQNGDASINTIVLNPGKEKAVLYFGGNAEAVVLNAELFIKDFPNSTVYLIDYRGYGASTGKPNEQALYADALFIYDQLKDQFAAISVIGRSLGSGVASLLASQRKIDRLVLITPYDSIVALAERSFPWFPVALFLNERYDSLSRVGAIKAETLILLAEFDLIVPRTHSQRLAHAFPDKQVRVEVIKGSDHNSLSLSPRYHVLLQQFLK